MAALIKCTDVSIDDKECRIVYTITPRTLFNMSLFPKETAAMDRDVLYIGSKSLSPIGCEPRLVNNLSTVYTNDKVRFFKIYPGMESTILECVSGYIKSNLRFGPDIKDNPLIVCDTRSMDESEYMINRYFPDSCVYSIDKIDEIESLRKYGTKYPVNDKTSMEILSLQSVFLDSHSELDAAITRLRMEEHNQKETEKENEPGIFKINKII